MAPSPTEARFPAVAPAAGHYESWYLKLSHPDQPLGLWIRYTIHKRPGQEPRGSLWFTLFDAAAEGPVASKVTFDAGELTAGGETYVRIGPGTFAPGGATGETGVASWELSFEPGGPPLHHLPREWMYRAPVPRTKLLSPYPAARFSGHADVDGRRVELESWPATVGHNWGAQHAERWIWMHGIELQGSPGAWLDMGIGRIKLGPVTTPWIANGAIELDGERHSLGGPAAVRRTEIDERPDGCRFTVPGSGLTVRGEVSAPAKDFVGWVYSDPDGSEHNTVNCSMASMDLTVEREGRDPLRLSTPHGGAYELGMRETDHGIRIQPFPDP